VLLYLLPKRLLPSVSVRPSVICPFQTSFLLIDIRYWSASVFCLESLRSTEMDAPKYNYVVKHGDKSLLFTISLPLHSSASIESRPCAERPVFNSRQGQ
jgi:hypothetical protein